MGEDETPRRSDAPVSSPPPNVSDSPQRSRHFRWETARRGNLTCHAAALITLICTSMFCTLSPWILRVWLVRLDRCCCFISFANERVATLPTFDPVLLVQSCTHPLLFILILLFVSGLPSCYHENLPYICCNCCMKCQTAALKNVLLNQK